jgi:hypothetical protein
MPYTAAGHVNDPTRRRSRRVAIVVYICACYMKAKYNVSTIQSYDVQSEQSRNQFFLSNSQLLLCYEVYIYACSLAEKTEAPSASLPSPRI